MRYFLLSQPLSSPVAPGKGQSGFTLLEMMATISIFGILAALVVPNFGQFREIYRLRGATREVFIDLQKARMAAIKDNNRYRFSVVDDTHYRIHDDEDGDGNEDMGETITLRSIAENRPGVTLGAMTDVIFLPNGTVRFVDCCVGTFWLANASGQSRTISIGRGGGRIVIVD